MNKKALFESVYGNKEVSDKEKKTLMETVEEYAIELAEDKINSIEKEYADKFASMTESVSTNMMELVDGAINTSADKLTKEPTIKYLMESITKIKTVLEDIGLRVDTAGSIDSRMSSADDRYKKSVELLSKAKSLVDQNRDKINTLRVENYIRKALVGMDKEIVEKAVKEFSDIPIDEIEDELLLWLENEDFTKPSSPRELDISEDIDIDEIDKDLEELDELVGDGNLFESTDENGKKKISKPTSSVSKLESIKMKPINLKEQVSDATPSQLEALSKGEDEISGGFTSDVDEAVDMMKQFGSQFRL